MTIPQRKAEIGSIDALIGNLAKDVPPTQVVRELTQNGIDAVAKVGTGEVHWTATQAFTPGVNKLVVWDNGIGMTPEEFQTRFNTFSAVAQTEGNFGVGAKLSLVRSSPHGVILCSVKDNQGAMAHLGLRDGSWGLLPLEGASAEDPYTAPIPAGLLPEEITEHGTYIVLLGTSEEDDTTLSMDPTSVDHRWITRYLNSRLVSIPAGITIRDEVKSVRTGRNDNMGVKGLRHYLEYYQSSEGSQGSVRLEVEGLLADVHWFALDANPHKRSLFSGAGTVGLVYQDEVYHTTHRSALLDFGITLNQHRVTLLVEAAPGQGVLPNQQRTGLSRAGEDIPLHVLGKAFRKVMPSTLVELMDEERGKSQKSATADRRLESMLDQVLPLMRSTLSVGAHAKSELPTSRVRSTSTSSATSSTRTGTRGTKVKGQASQGSGSSAQVLAQRLPLPEVYWLSGDQAKNAGLLNEAGRYSLEENVLYLNKDCAAFTSLMEVAAARYVSPETAERARIAVQGYCEEAMVSSVVTTRDSRPPAEYARRLDEVAITAKAESMQLPFERIKQQLPSALGRFDYPFAE